MSSGAYALEFISLKRTKEERLVRALCKSYSVALAVPLAAANDRLGVHNTTQEIIQRVAYQVQLTSSSTVRDSITRLIISHMVTVEDRHDTKHGVPSHIVVNRSILTKTRSFTPLTNTIGAHFKRNSNQKHGITRQLLSMLMVQDCVWTSSQLQPWPQFAFLTA